MDPLLDPLLTDEQRAWGQKARTFAEARIKPISLERDLIADPKETFDWQIVKDGSREGFRTAVIPKEYGTPGIDAVTQVLVIAELSKADSAISKTFSQCWKWGTLMVERCTEDQKARFLKPFLDDDTYLLGMAGTEPTSGSDNRTQPDELTAGWMLTADRDGDEWVLNGTKRYIANGGVAKLYFVGTRTDRTVNMAQGGTVFLVPGDAPGLRVSEVHDKIGWRFYQNAELTFENVRIPHTNMLGELNKGVAARTGGALEFNEIELAANAIGVCDAATEMAMERAKSRWQGGSYIIEHQAIQLKLAEMNMLTEALRAFVMNIARAADSDGGFNKAHIILAMNFATDVIQRVTHLNMDVHGAEGIMKDTGAEKLVRDAAIWTHLAGDSVQRMKVIKHLR